MYGTINAANVQAFDGSVSAQSIFMVSHKYPLAQANSNTYSDYWQAVFNAGSGKIPFVLMNPGAAQGANVDPGWLKALEKSSAEGYQNIAYIRTIQQTRPLADVKAEVDNHIKLYGTKNIHGFWFDEVSALSNAGAAYMAELYNYVKTAYGNKMVLANPGGHITDQIAPYADLWVTNESTHTAYKNYQPAKSAFENDPANAHRIMHIVYDVNESDYQNVINLTRSRNAGWVYISSDSISPDGRPYNDLPKNFAKLADNINALGTPAKPNGSATQALLSGAKTGTTSASTDILDADSNPAPTPPAPPAWIAAHGYTRLAFEDSFDSLATIDTTASGAPGYKWYTAGVRHWGKADTTPDEYRIDHSVLTLDPTHRSFNYNLSTSDPNTRNGQQFGHGYYEARIKFAANPHIPNNTENQGSGDDGYAWPSFWAQEHARFDKNFTWDNFKPYIEIDFMESQRPNEVLWTNWSWLGKEPTQMVRNKYHYYSEPGLDLSEWHTYGTLWGPGFTELYIDGKLARGHYWTGDQAQDPKQAPVNAHGENYHEQTDAIAQPFAQYDEKGTHPVLDVILGTGTGRPMDIDWVRIWQADTPQPKPYNAPPPEQHENGSGYHIDTHTAILQLPRASELPSAAIRPADSPLTLADLLSEPHSETGSDTGTAPQPGTENSPPAYQTSAPLLADNSQLLQPDNLII